MEYVKIGDSELNVSRVCMGCMGFGNPEAGMHSWTLSEADSREIIKRGLELGVNFLTPPLHIRAVQVRNTSAGYSGGLSSVRMW